jgi:hypothetical protein
MGRRRGHEQRQESKSEGFLAWSHNRNNDPRQARLSNGAPALRACAAASALRRLVEDRLGVALLQARC